MSIKSFGVRVRRKGTDEAGRVVIGWWDDYWLVLVEWDSGGSWWIDRDLIEEIAEEDKQ